MVGKFCISLDFELMWGMKDTQTIASYGENILGIRSAIPAMLELFNSYELQATWATVGFLLCRNKDELIDYSPAILPEYKNQSLSNYSYFNDVGNNENDDPYHYAASLVRYIKDIPGQEIASHSFSHYYCCEDGATLNSFQADVEAFKSIAKTWNVKLKSFVFARNQLSDPHVELLVKHGITNIRSNERHCAYDMSSSSPNSKLRKAFRLADSYINLSGSNVHDIEQNGGAIYIPSSRFLRPYNSGLSMLEKMKLNRIRRAMTVAAKEKKIFHLWWHPHNFGLNTERNIHMLRAIAEYYRYLSDVYGMESVSMGNISQ